MYSIYCDEICIYDDTVDDASLRLISPTVEWQDNAAGTLSFTMPEVNVGYNTLVLMSSFITVLKNSEEIWWGRPIKESKDFWKNRQITCEGALAFLNDVIQPMCVYEQDPTMSALDDTVKAGETQYQKQFNGYPNSFLKDIIANHNAKSFYKFKMGLNDVRRKMVDEDDNDEFFEYILVRVDSKNTLECISEKLTNKEEVGGHIYVSGRDADGYFILNYLKDPTDDMISDQIIEFGTNLLDFTQGFDDTQFCTVLYPRGKQEDEVADGLNSHEELTEDVTETTYYNEDEPGDPGIKLEIKHPYIVNNEGKALYGWVEKIMDFSDADDETELKQKAIEWMTKHRFKEVELDIKAFDLSYLDIDYNTINFFQKVRVVSQPHGLDRYFPVLGISIPLDQPQNATYTLGKKKVATLSSYTSSVQKDVEKNADLAEIRTNKYANDLAAERERVDAEVIKMQEEIAEDIEDAKEEVGNFIVSATKGRVTLDRNANGYATAIVIADIEDNQVDNFNYKSSQTGMWVWNYNGLAFYPNGPNSDPRRVKKNDGSGEYITVGITNDGRIVADDISACTITANQITAGTLDCANITVKNINADWITTGTLQGVTLYSAANYEMSGTRYTKIQDGFLEIGNKGGSSLFTTVYNTSTSKQLLYLQTGNCFGITKRDPANYPQKIVTLWSGTDNETIKNPLVQIDGDLFIGNGTNRDHGIIFSDTSSTSIPLQTHSNIYRIKDDNNNIVSTETYRTPGIESSFIFAMGGYSFHKKKNNTYIASCMITDIQFGFNSGVINVAANECNSGYHWTFAHSFDRIPIVFCSINTIQNAPTDDDPNGPGNNQWACVINTNNITKDGFWFTISNYSDRDAYFLRIYYMAIEFDY